MTVELMEHARENAASYDVDLYSDAVIDDPYPHYRAIRDLGPAVWLPRNDAFAIARFTDVRNALRDPARFLSGRGVMMNAATNEGAAGRSIICTDAPAHTSLRQLMVKPLMPAALAALREEISTAADALVEGLVARGRFDGVKEFAHYLPTLIVSRLVGLPAEGRDKMLAWASDAFNQMGNDNARYEAALAGRDVAVTYLFTLKPADLLPDSWGARLFTLVEEAKLDQMQARWMLHDYVAPALDTTINATSSAIWLLGTHPEQWAMLRAEPRLIPAAIDEAMRLEAPIRAFSRYVDEDAQVDGTIIPGGSRALILYASANRDERYWPEADRFDIRRKAPQEQMSFGSGPHMCVGMHLARMEMRAIFEALVRRVARFEVGEPHRERHNVLRGIASIDVSITEAA